MKVFHGPQNTRPMDLGTPALSHHLPLGAWEGPGDFRDQGQIVWKGLDDAPKDTTPRQYFPRGCRLEDNSPVEVWNSSAGSHQGKCLAHGR